MFITAIEFHRFSKLLKRNSGVVLADDKQYLVANRLQPLVEDIGVDRLSDLLEMITVLPNNSLMLKALDAITTDENTWFRETSHFNYLETTLFAQLIKNNPSLSVWSAGCSSGEEVYSISLSLNKYMQKSGQQVDAKIVATDMSTSLLSKAESGVYTDKELYRGLSNELRNEHFCGIRGGFQISSIHRERVCFSQLNLLDDFSSLGQFDLVFCRKVLPYFSTLLRQDILNRIVALMKPGAYLFLDSSEAMPVEVTGLDTIRNSTCKCYRKR